ncbi:MAG: hypothetical protein V4457_11735 [Pseudomonadota bacterium]
MRIKLLAWFAVHAPETPTQYLPPSGSYQIFGPVKDFVASHTYPTMPREQWCAEWAALQLAEFEKMWESL